MSLSHILQFVTGAKEEPVWGFATPKFTIFTIYYTFIPTANTCTCINCLNLPHPSRNIPLLSEDKLFNLYNLVFSNTFIRHV